MARIWADIVLTAAIAGAIAAQTVGVEVERSSRIRGYFPQDTLSSSKGGTRDTTQSPADTLPARDSLLAPGDTLTIPRDSLSPTDTLPVRDSAFIADSIKAAQDSFRVWYASLSKAERKRYDYEQKLPAILHRQDSILRRKDSIQKRRDSIIENTPRILETPYLPDTMYYKRLVTWHHGRMYNNVETFQWDTSANYHFYDYSFMREDVGASWQGMPGTAVQTYNFFLRDAEDSPEFYAPYECWTYTPSSLPMFNTKTPYTELEYSGNLFSSSTKSADAFRVFTTQNILPSLNIALEMKRYGGAGTLKNDDTDNRTYFAAANYLGKRYLAHGGLIYNNITHQENGGVQDNMWIRDTTVDVREIEVNLASAANRFKKTTLFFDQSYRIPLEFIEELRHKGDTSWVKKDSVDMPTFFVGSASEYSEYTKKYVDNTSTALAAFYNNVFNLNPSKSQDSLRAMVLDNRIFFRLQPWKEDFAISKIEGGIGDRLQNFYILRPQDYLTKPSPVQWNSVYTYAGAEGRILGFDWDAQAKFTFAGYEAGDFSLGANAKLVLHPFRRHKNSPLTIKAGVKSTLKEPSFYQQNFYSNHYSWTNNFEKISTTRADASIDIPRWGLSAGAGYALLVNNIYYNTLGAPEQNTVPMSVVSAYLRKDIVAGAFHFENRALAQFSSNSSVLPLPALALNLRWYAQFNVVDPSTLRLQLGINTRYTTLWYAPSFNPVAGVFMNQEETLYGNCPIFDIFINAQWRKCCIFVKYENATKGWPMDAHDYFTAHHYIQNPAAVKVGISWPFYPRSGKTRTMSERAGSGMGMGLGASGLKSGLSSFTGN